jgi:hypothetical protein
VCAFGHRLPLARLAQDLNMPNVDFLTKPIDFPDLECGSFQDISETCGHSSHVMLQLSLRPPVL